MVLPYTFLLEYTTAYIVILYSAYDVAWYIHIAQRYPRTETTVKRQRDSLMELRSEQIVDKLSRPLVLVP